MKLAYVIGAYRSSTVYGVSRNIEAAAALAAELWQAGFAVICPHKNSAFFDGIVSDNTFIAGDLEILKRCDIAVTVDGWEYSTGSINEVNFCKAMLMPVYHSVKEAASEA
jgi:hypothetical protein